MERWAGRVAIVTGAGAGIGVAISRLLAENGMTVVCVECREERVKALAADFDKYKGKIHAVQGDVTKEEDVERVVTWTRKNLGGADVLVNNAGTMFPVSLAEADTEKIKIMLDLNVLGLCMFTRDVIKDMRSRGVDDGHIFNLNSIHGQSILERQGAAVYGGSKHAGRVITEGLRRELRDLGTKMKVTSISPGRVRTELAQIVFGFTPEAAAAHYNKLPCLEPRDIADALLYALASPPHVQVHEITLQPV